MLRSLRTRITAYFVVFAIIPLLALGAILLYESYRFLNYQAIALQGEISSRAAATIWNYLHALQREIQSTASINNLMKLDPARQHSVIAALRAYDDTVHKDAFDELALLDSTGNVLVRVSRTNVFHEKDIGRRGKADVFIRPLESKRTYSGLVWFDERTGEPFMTMSVPIIDRRTDAVAGIIIAKIRLKDIWDLIGDIHVGESGSVFIADSAGRVLAFKDPSVVLRGTLYRLPDSAGIHKGILGGQAVVAAVPIHFGDQILHVVTERPVSEALRLTVQIFFVIIGLLLSAIAGAVTFGLMARRQVIAPIETLADMARAVSAGDFSKKADIKNQDELGALANAFNSMTSRLHNMIEALTETVADRNKTNAELRNAMHDLQTANEDLEREIYARTKIERELKRSEALLKASQRIAHVGSWELDIRHNSLVWTDEIYNIFEIDQKRFSASYEGFLDMVHPDDREAVHQAYASSVANKTPYDIVHRLSFPDGRMKFVHEWGETYYDDGSPVVSICAVQDITVQKMTEEALLKQRDLFKAMIESLPGVFYLFTRTGKMLRWNRNMETVTGFSPEEIAGKNAIGFFHDADKAIVAEAIGEVFRTGMAFVEARAVMKDGREVPYLMTGGLCYVDDAPCVLGVGIDITDRKEAEKALDESHERLITILDSLDSGVYVADIHTHELLFINKYFRKQFGDAVGKPCWQVLQAGQTGPCEFCTNNKLISPEGKPAGIYVWEFRNTVNGRWYECHDQAVTWVDGRLVRLEIATDVTERKQFEEELHSEKERLVVTLASIADAVIATDRRGRIILLNAGAEALTGWSQLEAYGRPLEDVFYIMNEQTRLRCDNPVQKILETGATVGLGSHTVLIAKDGSERLIADSVAPIRDHHNSMIGMVLVFRDITASRKVENELINAKKLESIAILAAGVAHEINNPLTNASLNVQLLKQRLQKLDDPSVLEKLEAVERNMDRASIIASELLLFSRQGEGEFMPLNINKLLTGVLVLLDHRLGKITVKRHLNSVPDINGDPVRLEQVFLNILTNAIEAMPQGGEISVSTACTNNQIRIEISDTGVGIPADILSKVFDPFFTTKQVGAGTGLGLSICYGIVRQHGGYVDIMSPEGEGTTVYVLLPAYTG